MTRTKNKKTSVESTVWIIVCAFVLLVVFGGIIWFVFSGRADQKIHGENLDKLTDSTSEPAAPNF